jgi:hypothetical protein
VRFEWIPSAFTPECPIHKCRIANRVGHNDHLEDDHPELPPEAGRDTPSGFEPDDAWFEQAEPEMRYEAMRRWFLSRYCDPANDTPHDSEEGGYLYIHGGPYTADDELYNRFGDICSDEAIREAIDDIESDGIDEWAPIYHEREEEYDPRFALTLTEGSEPLQRLRERLQQSQQVLTLQGGADAMALAQKLVFSSVIGALEAFLYETAYFWIETDDSALRALVAGLPSFREEKISLAELFKRHEGIKDHVKGYLQNLVWHRWDRVASVFKHALCVRLPGTRDFDAPLLKRHDIVHRSGQDKNGATVSVTAEEIAELCSQIEAFAEELDTRIASRNIEVVDLSSVDDPAPEP